MDERRIPKSLSEAYRLRDASVSPEGWDFYQEQVYRLRAREYLSRGLVTRRGIRQRELERSAMRPGGGPRSKRETWSAFVQLYKFVFG
jgi:hypothetical protein